MFQSFTATTRPEQGPPRLAALRGELARAGLDGFVVPRADAHQGEWVAARDERLAWLTGFTGSAGFCIVTATRAGVFVDGRYRVQVKAQVALEHFTPVDWPETDPAAWLREALPDGGRVGFDPWLHAPEWLEKLERGLEGAGIVLVAVAANPVDAIWPDQPDPPDAPAVKYPTEFAGEGDAVKRARIAGVLKEAGHRAAVLTLPDSICWLLNIRGRDIARTPVVHAFAILHDDGRVALFATPGKFDGLGPDPAITVGPTEDFVPTLATLTGPVRIDPASVPVAVARALDAAGVETARGQDPCILPKACKNAVEVAGARTAHARDGAAMVEFLAWLDAQGTRDDLSEIEIVTALEGFRRASNELRDISFETICGSGPNGALPHYRVTEESNRRVRAGELIVVDSGGQYLDGTTDITRTVVHGGGAPADAVRAFTLVLKGVIAISRLVWPKGLAGRDLDPFARAALWRAGLDFDHGTGHGVGHYMGVHEGPQRLSRIGHVPLEPGMILSNEPGYYREGAFGIRTENLLVVQPAPRPGGADDREMLQFETLCFVPIDRRLIDAHLLTGEERDWLNAYHAQTRDLLAPRVSRAARDWLVAATEPV